MTLLSPEMCLNSGLVEGSFAVDLIAKLSDGLTDVLDGLLATDDSRAAALQSLPNLPSYTLMTFAQVGSMEQKFVKFFLEGCALPVLVGKIGTDDIVNPVTEFENLLFWACIDTRSPLHENWRNQDGGCFLDWRVSTKAIAIVAFPTSHDTAPLRRLIAALFSLEHSELSVARVGRTSLDSAISVTSRVEPDKFTATQARLVFEALSETNPKWRCLSFYRILENAYLANIKRILNDSFDFDAKTSLAQAIKSVSSEVQQLLALTETLGLQAEFLNFNTAVEVLLTGRNKFIEALDKGAQEDRELYGHRELWRKAVLRFYKFRCSIAHGGTSSVIYEQFVDASAAALTLLPSVEEIAFGSLKLEIDI